MREIITMTIIGLLIAANSWAVVVTGSGTTKEEAINNGLRESVEMFTGALVYGVTDVENYQLQKDQIVATTFGYVKGYRIIKTSKMDDLILVTLDVNVSENKIEGILRNNVKLITYEDVLKDYNNVTQRQEQMLKFAEMIKIMAKRPVREKYGIVYEGYEIKRINPTHVDVILNTRVTVNPFYSRAYNEILKNLSVGGWGDGIYGLGGNYRIENGRMVNSKYYIPTRELKTPIIDEVHAQVHVNGVPVDKCREYRDNLMVAYSPTAFVIGFVNLFPKMFMKKMNNEEGQDEEPSDTSKWDNAGIKNSKIIPAAGLPLKIKYRISDSKDIKQLRNLKLSMDSCGKGK